MQLHINQRQSLSSLTAVCSCITAAQAAPQQLATARELLMTAPMQLHVNQRQSLSSPSAVCSCIVAAQAAPQQLATAKELLMAARMQLWCSSVAVAQLPESCTGALMQFPCSCIAAVAAAAAVAALR